MELIIVLIIILVLFGSSRLPTIGKFLERLLVISKGLSGNKKTDVKTKKEVSEEGKKGGE
jgi:Sec-independent protein translocase protein TatA